MTVRAMEDVLVDAVEAVCEEESLNDDDCNSGEGGLNILL